jgi:hypothetical protein
VVRDLLVASRDRYAAYLIVARRDISTQQAGYIDADFLHSPTFPLQSDGGPYIEKLRPRSCRHDFRGTWSLGASAKAISNQIRLIGTNAKTLLPDCPSSGHSRLAIREHSV